MIVTPSMKAKAWVTSKAATGFTVNLDNDGDFCRYDRLPRRQRVRPQQKARKSRLNNAIDASTGGKDSKTVPWVAISR